MLHGKLEQVMPDFYVELVLICTETTLGVLDLVHIIWRGLNYVARWPLH